MSESQRRQLLLVVARLYYGDQKWSKTKISSELDIPTMQVGRLLREAEDKGIVRFSFVPPEDEGLAGEVMSKYTFLRRVVIVPHIEDVLAQQETLGSAAAKYFESEVFDGARVALSGGNTVYQMVKRIPEKERRLDIYPTAIIGRGPTTGHLDPMVLATLLWARSGAELGSKVYSVTVPPVKDNTSLPELAKEYRRIIKDLPEVDEVFEGMQSVDFVFASIGSVKTSERYRRARKRREMNLFGAIKISESDLRQLENDGVVGDINYSLFNSEGQTMRENWSPFRTLGVGVLRGMVQERGLHQKRVVIVVGQYKITALKAALAGQICNVLITDDAAARELLEEKANRSEARMP
jgi:deoxyribonucleoside regulator